MKNSVIIPVYNSEKYLDKCIQSVLNQSFTVFELLLINDELTDKNKELCETYAQQDKRARNLRKCNIFYVCESINKSKKFESFKKTVIKRFKNLIKVLK